MLASVYSYRVMVKSVSSCCVRGRRVLSNPVTYLDAWHLLNNRLYSWLANSWPSLDIKAFSRKYSYVLLIR